MMTIHARCKQLGIRAYSTLVNVNPNNPEWKEAHHYRVTLRRDRPHRELTTYFSMGYAHSRKPEAADVLDSLANDAIGFENAKSFEDWCGELGFDTDSRKAERTFRIIEKQAKQLRRFLGDEYDVILYQTERL